MPTVFALPDRDPLSLTAVLDRVEAIGRMDPRDQLEFISVSVAAALLVTFTLRRYKYKKACYVWSVLTAPVVLFTLFDVYLVVTAPPDVKLYYPQYKRTFSVLYVPLKMMRIRRSLWPWARSVSYCRIMARSARAKDQRGRHKPTCLSSAYDILGDLLVEHGARHGFNLSPSYLDAVVLMVDSLLDRLIPTVSPGPQYRFLPDLFLLFVLPYPLYTRRIYIYRRFLSCITRGLLLDAPPAFAIVDDALVASVNLMELDGMSPIRVIPFVRSYLYPSQAVFYAGDAERAAHQAILDAVLAWKRKKEDRARLSRLRRVKSG
ncbi:hypothetical protein JCM8097_005988 [Rhodosporidiobolus ruineniae]